jgi:arginyl-tRNA synthetase
VIPGDLAAELARLIQSQVASGALPASAVTRSAAGTWRPPPAPRGTPGSYATSLPFELAALAGRPAESVAAQFAEGLADVPWISAARATKGYLTITVTQSQLAGLPGRIVAAGPECARSQALAGYQLTAPRPPDLTASANWPQAWRAQHEALIGQLGHAAGAEVRFSHLESNDAGTASPRPRVGTPGAAVAYFGVDAVRYALSRAAGPTRTGIERQLSRPLDRSNPFFLARYAHADAASTLRWASDLGLSAPPLRAPRIKPPMPVDLRPGELELLDAMSWLPERVAAAFRRRRPAELTSHLERLAQAWLDCSERYPALPFRGGGAVERSGATALARLELAEAAMTASAAGLGLLGVAAPAMM